MSTELTRIRVPLMLACPAPVCRHFDCSRRRLGALELKFFAYGTSQPLTRRVKTTVERQIAGVASSNDGEETARNVAIRPLATSRLSTSQPLARHRRYTAVTAPLAFGPSETSHGFADEGSGASVTVPPGERSRST